MRRFRFLIIGAGPAGLFAARRLLDSGERDVLILEKNRWPGGLSASFLDRKGFTWDLGGHVIHSHYREYDRILASLIPSSGWLSHRREAWIYYPDGWVPYPFQLHLDHLSPELRERCLEGLRRAASAGKPPAATDFLSWARSRFGEGIAALFMEPYNRKVWRMDTARMGVYWLGDRVALPPLGRSSPASTRKDWGPNACFRFPRRGGTGAICRRLADSLGRGRIRYGWEAVRIDTDRHVVSSRAGRRIGYDVLLSTAPLDLVSRSCRPRVKETRAIAGRLVATPVAVVGLGLRGPRPEKLDHVTWMYFPEKETRIYRLTNFSRYSPANVPTGRGVWSLMLELSALPSRVDLKALAEKAIGDIRRFGLFPKETSVVSLWSRLLPYGYPVPMKDREGARPALLGELERRGIYSRGRFGAWLYEVGNMDHSAMQGVEWAERMLHGAPEMTINDPRGVNAAPAGK
jgi:protoporphyrinogen oxidase